MDEAIKPGANKGNKMNGSEKQIGQANEIKDMFLNGKVLSAHHSHKGLVNVLEEKEKFLAKRQARGKEISQIILDDIAKITDLIEKIINEKNASWFLDNIENPRIKNFLG